MRIVLDLQGAQAENRFRGIGRYTLSLAQAIACNRGKHELLIVLNGLFPDTIEPIRGIFNGLMPQNNIFVWQAATPVCSLIPENEWRRRSAELVREAFLSNLKPDMVLVSSLFEGLVDNAVTSIGMLAKTVPTAVILYDLIPLINRDPYLKNPLVEAWYEAKLDHLRRANLLFAISESSRQEGVRYLGFSENESINISTAADSRFEPRKISALQEKAIRNRYGLHGPFVMYTGGIDHRKNIEGLIRAYALLPKALRAKHRLAVVCSIQSNDQARLESLARGHGLSKGELVLTGFVPDDDLVVLYNLCKVFVFPSWHEGFGLPALEAMSCGAPTIGSNCTSIPEVIGREDALFDPRSDDSIAEKLAQVLTDDVYRTELARHGLKQAKRFSWDESALRAIHAMEKWHLRHVERPTVLSAPAKRPKLAYVSPLPPARSGISSYSAELLPELSRHYDIEVIVAQESVSDAWVRANAPIRSVDWFRKHAERYERVLYHFGNSAFHRHMFDLLEEIQGVVVLHDFFLSGIVHHIGAYDYRPDYWEKELHRAHGYKAMREKFHDDNPDDVIWRYPCNLSVLQKAKGIIVHSQHSRWLAKQWYGPGVANDWSIIPHLRTPGIDADRAAARYTLGLSDDDYVTCSFGLLGPTKLNHRLLDAWLASSLISDERCILVFVGESAPGDYNHSIHKTIKGNGLKKRIRITGWTDLDTFRRYLIAADVAVQLRTHSRGETSGTILDCMNYGLPTIVNANGSMADLPADAVSKLPDEFSDSQLIDALENLWKDRSLRLKISKCAKEVIYTCHAPRACAEQYAESIERYYRESAGDQQHLLEAIAGLESPIVTSQQLTALANAIAESIPPRYAPRQLLVDISELIQRDVGTGIQRVVRTILAEWLKNAPNDFRVEPVYATQDQGYRYARCFTLRFIGCANTVLDDEPIEFRAGDVFVGLDLQSHVVTAQREFYRHLRRRGIEVYFVVYDLLCILMPQYFLAGAKEIHSKWLSVVAESDGVICISKAVADEFLLWVKEFGPQRCRPLNISWFHLGSDICNSPLQGKLPKRDKVFKGIRKCPSFTMVGTIEARKGYAQALAAFEALWDKGVNVNFIIVGKEGWLVEPLIEKFRFHPERGKRLFWLEGISDEYLKKVYAISTCLIAASEGEGFGLPLIEAAQHKLPIIARDIPVFREVAGEYAYYFRGTEPAALADALQAWLKLYESGKHPRSDDMPWLTWEQSAARLKEIILEGDWYAQVGAYEQTAGGTPYSKNVQEIEADRRDGLQRHG